MLLYKFSRILLHINVLLWSYILHCFCAVSHCIRSSKYLTNCLCPRWTLQPHQGCRCRLSWPLQSMSILWFSWLVSPVSVSSMILVVGPLLSVSPMILMVCPSCPCLSYNSDGWTLPSMSLLWFSWLASPVSLSYDSHGWPLLSMSLLWFSWLASFVNVLLILMVGLSCQCLSYDSHIYNHYITNQNCSYLSHFM